MNTQNLKLNFKKRQMPLGNPMSTVWAIRHGYCHVVAGQGLRRFARL